MADLKISQLSSATALAGTEVVPVVQGDATKKATIDQILSPASGKGIDFSASGGDVLKYYDEGTWTPTVTPQSGSLTAYTSNGHYTRIGNLVTVQCSFVITTPGTAAGVATIGEMPFNAGGYTGSAGTGIVLEYWNTGISYNITKTPSSANAVINTAANGPLGWGSGDRYTFTLTYMV